ncbi:MAG: reverse transcriptase domain-containing protein [Candidatus Parcubacteria bacterium]|nr:reverse transcriptase domain-containing protein [Candidatus Parcubacteria bacterium]
MDKEIYSQITSFPNLLNSYKQAKENKTCRPYIIEYNWKLENSLIALQNELVNKTYKTGRYKTFIVHDPKERQIFAAPFKDRIVHHALCNIIEPIFEKTFIFDSYACRREKGSHKAVKRVQKFMRAFKNEPFYILKGDVRHYFDSVNRRILFNLIKKKVSDEATLNLIEQIIYSTPGEIGIPIGNLTSQLFANIYLNELDQVIKRKLNGHYYCRYVDDFVLLKTKKAELLSDKLAIEYFLKDSLGLQLHPKKQTITPNKIGIDLVGYHIFSDHILIRQSNVKLFLRRFKSGNMPENAIFSCLGHFKIADSCGLYRKISKIYVQRYTHPSENLRNRLVALSHY